MIRQSAQVMEQKVYIYFDSATQAFVLKYDWTPMGLPAMLGKQETKDK